MTGLRAGPRNDLTDVAGIRVGHHQRTGRGWRTGTTVVLTPPGTVGSVDVRGGGPATRETDALAPTALVDAVHAVVLTGGSAYGLAAADGVTGWLAEAGTGFPVGPDPDQVVPIVAAAALFDLGAGGVFANRPDASWGRAAAGAARPRRLRQGSVGAGTGARTGAATGVYLRGGLGSASVVLADGTVVAALVAANPGGSVVDPATGVLYGAAFGLPGEFDLVPPDATDLARPQPTRPWATPPAGSPAPADPSAGADGGGRGPTNTVLAVVATDAELTKGECHRLAVVGHDGMARAVRPVHAMTDGDVVFALATGTRPLGGPGRAFGADSRPGRLGELMAAAADAVSRSVVAGVLAAAPGGSPPTYRQHYPSSRPVAP